MHSDICLQLCTFLLTLKVYFCSLMSYDPVKRTKRLKILLANYRTLMGFIWHIMYALCIPEFPGHVQSDSALFINISTL